MKTFEICFDPHSVQIFVSRRVEPFAYYWIKDETCSLPNLDDVYSELTFDQWKDEMSFFLNVEIDWNNVKPYDSIKVKSKADVWC